MPDVAVFGQKDLQQAAVVKAMVRDLNFPVGILVAPTVREPDGLAMSSRNRYLSPKDRELALILSKALFAMRDAFGRGERRASALEATGWRMLERVAGLTPRYLAAVNADTFQRVNNVRHGDAAVGAVRVGETRLIDNIIF
jgi:pantoate--beta-alanine ligase